MSKRILSSVNFKISEYVSYAILSNNFLVISIEDPFDQNDWESWVKLTSSTSIQIVGDDLTVTNPTRIATAVEMKACNALLLKINQIGTISESIEAYSRCKAFHLQV